MVSKLTVRLSNITKIVVGKSSNNKRSLIKKQSLVDQLMPLVTNIEMYIVPDSNVQYKEGKVLLKRKTIILTKLLSHFSIEQPQWLPRVFQVITVPYTHIYPRCLRNARNLCWRQ